MTLLVNLPVLVLLLVVVLVLLVVSQACNLVSLVID
jgi:hypothetical protein